MKSIFLFHFPSKIKKQTKKQTKKQKRMVKIAAALLSFSLLCSSAWLPAGTQTATAAEAGAATRLWGQTQYDTAKAIAEQVGENPGNVVLASGRGFADALSAGVLAYGMNVPILLVEKDPADSASAPALSYITAHMPPGGTVWMVGGTAVIDNNFAAELQGMGYNTKRIGGYDQYETSALVAQAANVAKGTPVVIASGENFPDALSFASIAANRGWPVLLVPHNQLPAQTADCLARQQPGKVYIAGGTAAIGTPVESAIRQGLLGTSAIQRFGGYDQYDTAALILAAFTPSPAKLFVASGNHYPDALAGSVLAAQSGSPIMLVNSLQAAAPQAMRTYLSQLQPGTGVTVLGGEKVVPAALVSDILAKIGEPLPEWPASTKEFSFDNLAVGVSEEQVLDTLGSPQREDPSEYGFTWYIYNKDYKNYLQVGIQNGKAVAFYTGSADWQSKKGIKIGSSRSSVDQSYSTSAKQIGIPDDNEYRTYLVDNSYVTLFYDLANNNTVCGVQVLDKAVGDSLKGYYGTLNTGVQKAYEREIFDLTNVGRVRMGLKAFVWDNTIAGTAEKHSSDMAAHNYFSHDNLQGQTPFDRMKADGIVYNMAGENIAAGQTDAMFAYHGWMNSAGHRANILDDYTYLGVGVAFGGDYQVYYTQDFYTPLN